MITRSRVYLDYAATAPVRASSIKTFTDVLSSFGNPSSPHAEGRNAKRLLEEARARIARLAGVKPRSVIFTSGATESNALAIQGYLKKLASQQDEANKTGSSHVLYLPTAHASTVHSVLQLKNEGYTVEELPLQNGKIDLLALEQMVMPRTDLVIIDAVCGETGTRFDVRGVRKALDVARTREGISHIQLHVDASQLPLVESFERLRLCADTVTLDAQKVGSIRGVGALIVGDVSNMAPIMFGGGQEEGLRPGTEPVALICAFAEALEEVTREREEFVERATRLRAALIKTLEDSSQPPHILNLGTHAPHILSVSYPGIDTDYLVMILDAKGYSVSTKSACETDRIGSRAVLLLTGDNTLVQSTLRISWGAETADHELEAFSQELIKSVCTLYEQDAELIARQRA